MDEQTVIVKLESLCEQMSNLMNGSTGKQKNKNKQTNKQFGKLVNSEWRYELRKKQVN